MFALMEGKESSQEATVGNWEPQGVPSNISDAIFARRLRSIREQADMTQQQLADAMARTGSRIHRSTIGKIENGDRPVTVGEAVQIAGIFGVPLTELVRLRSNSQEMNEVDRLTDEFIHALTVVNSAMARANDARNALALARDAYESAMAEFKSANENANEVAEKLGKYEAGQTIFDLMIKELKNNPATKHIVIQEGE